MSLFASIGAQNVQPKSGSSGGSTLSGGLKRLRLIDIVRSPNKKGDGENFVTTFEVESSEAQDEIGKQVKVWYVITGNVDAMRIGMEQFVSMSASACGSLGAAQSINHESELMGKVVTASNAPRPQKNDPKYTENVWTYLDANGQKFGAAPAVNQGGFQQPQHSSQHPNGFSTQAPYPAPAAQPTQQYAPQPQQQFQTQAQGYAQPQTAAPVPQQFQQPAQFQQPPQGFQQPPVTNGQPMGGWGQQRA